MWVLFLRSNSQKLVQRSNELRTLCHNRQPSFRDPVEISAQDPVTCRETTTVPLRPRQVQANSEIQVPWHRIKWGSNNDPLPWITEKMLRTKKSLPPQSPKRVSCLLVRQADNRQWAYRVGRWSWPPSDLQLPGRVGIEPQVKHTIKSSVALLRPKAFARRSCATFLVL